MISLKSHPSLSTPKINPLDTVVVEAQSPGVFIIRDGRRLEYARSAPGQSSFSFRAGGHAGLQTICLKDDTGKVLASRDFMLEAHTEINDEGGKYASLLNMLHWTMVGWHGEAGTVRYKGKFYNFFVRWLRDHVHTLKGMKYFYPNLKTGIELFADSQREDGMVWDNVLPRDDYKSHWDNRFEYDDFIRPFPDGEPYELKRIPVENDVEYLFLEGLYYTWKATGDTDWMAGLLDNAIKAVEYSTTNPYRWSEKYQLLKRGYTIDTWDFQNEEDAAVMGDPMTVHPDKSRFGVMHGDNTGMAAGLDYLAEMLEAAERSNEAEKYRAMGKDIRKRLDEVSWNGQFFTHHVPEDTSVKRDFGVDESTQVSLSNAYALNRGITAEQREAIINTYQKIRAEMPTSSPGEWYQIYPIFQKGFGGHGKHWEYMNGGVTTIVAGELAHGAFENGFEDYGVDILNRLMPLGERHKRYFNCCFRGAMPDKPERAFTKVSIAGVANADFCGNTEEGVIGWSMEGDNDLHEMPVGEQVFEDIPFKVIDPTENQRRACLVLSRAHDAFASEASVPVNAMAKSVYFLHTMAGGPIAGLMQVVYADGSTHEQHILNNKHVGNWWIPRNPAKGRQDKLIAKAAWHGKNNHSQDVGVYVFGWDNPHPEKEISELRFKAAPEGSKWFILALTLSDYEVFFMPSEVSFGIPDNWGAAAVVYALIEGLAGIKDTGVAFDKALLAPRWQAAGVNKARATAKYEASGGYLSYEYAFDPPSQSLDLAFTSSTKQLDLEILMPSGMKIDTVTLDGESATFGTRTVKESTYICLEIEGNGVRKLEVKGK